MVIFKFRKEKAEIIIKEYDGNSGFEKVHDFLILKRPSKETLILDFVRHKNNISYTRGKVLYNENCQNILAISTHHNLRLYNVKNAFIRANNSSVRITPIFKYLNACKTGASILRNYKIKYNIPQAIFNRENLSEKDINSLKLILQDRYGIKVDEIKTIATGRTKNGIFYIREHNSECILKFRGWNQKKQELLTSILDQIPEYFPIQYSFDRSRFVFQIEKEFYGLEEYVRGGTNVERDGKYFFLLGKHIGILHNRLDRICKQDEYIINSFISNEGRSSESNIISIYLDLYIHGYYTLLPIVKELAHYNINETILNLQKGLIHRDLNFSNLIWQEGKPRIIDSETMGYSARVNEFESPLLYPGNMEKPIYIAGSLNKITNGYNEFSKTPLSKKEIEFILILIKFALIRNFTIRIIRRGLDDSIYFEVLNRNLRTLENDL